MIEPEVRGQKSEVSKSLLVLVLVLVLAPAAFSSPLAFHVSDTLDVSDRGARLLGHVTVDSAPSTAVTGIFWPATQPVSGTFWQTTQPVSIASMPSTPVTGTFWQATQPVSGTFWQATQPVSLATNTPDVTDRGARLLGHVTVDAAPTTAVTGTFWQATQPVSGTFWQATQPVSIASMPSTPVTGTFWQATQPVSGTVTANAGTNLNTSALALDATLTGGSQQTKITDGTNVASVKAASTAAGAADKAIVVAVSPNNSIAVTGTFWQATQPVSGTFWQATQPVSIASMPSTPVTGTFWQATQPVSGTFWQATQPVSISAANFPDNEPFNVAQVGGNSVVASVTGVQDVMPRKRTGSTGLAPNYSASHITTKTTTTVSAATAYVSGVAISVTGAGTSQTLVIQNKEATPKVLYTAGAAIVVGNNYIQFAEPILMTSGIDIVTGGTTAGTQDVFLTYWQ